MSQGTRICVNGFQREDQSSDFTLDPRSEPDTLACKEGFSVVFRQYRCQNRGIPFPEH